MFIWIIMTFFFFFFQAEDGIRDLTVTGVQTCALPISFRLRNILASGREYSNPRACRILFINGFALLQSVRTTSLEDCARNLSRILWPVASSLAIHGPR